MRDARDRGSVVSGALAVAVLTVVLSLVACGDGGTGPETPPDAPIRTLAYVVTECHDSASGAVARQRLEVMQGDGSAPRIVKELDAFGPLPRAADSCRVRGRWRFGHIFLELGVFQRLGVSPDGARVVFEVTDAFQTIRADVPAHPLADEEKGIFVIGVDGNGLRRLGPASRDAPFRGANFASILTLFAFSPRGDSVAFTDLGPGPDGQDVIQIVTLDLDTGRRTQVTRLPPGPPFDPARPETLSPFFVDADRIAFFSTANPDGLNPEQQLLPFTVRRDGTALMRGPQPPTVGGGMLVPQFAITGPAPNAVLLSPSADAMTGSSGFSILEVFLLDQDYELQLTNFGRDDITDATVSDDGRRVFFNASADPCADGRYQHCTGSNASRNCQIFSIDRTASDLRQLTAFNAGGSSRTGCYYSPVTQGGGCAVSFLAQDPHTQTLVFYSSCAPFAPPEFFGAQIYAIRPDGSGLWALTATRGAFTDPQGRSATELPGPLAYASSSARSLR